MNARLDECIVPVAEQTTGDHNNSVKNDEVNRLPKRNNLIFLIMTMIVKMEERRKNTARTFLAGFPAEWENVPEMIVLICLSGV